MDIGLVYMRARYYLPGVGRFVSADTIVPDKENPQAFNRYSYTANNPVKFVDPSGHCWGFASGLRNTFYSTTCENIDQALRIINHEDASAGEKALAVAYVGLEATAHATVVVGTGVAAVGCLTGAGTVICTGAGTATSAACSDGVCMNEAHMTVEGVSQVVNTLSADGDPSNEIRGAAAYLNRIQASGGFTAEQVRGWFQESNVTIRVQPQQLMGSVRGAYGAIGDGAAGYLRILPDAGRITWLHEFTHFLQDKAGGFQGFNMASTAQIELQAWSWMYNNAQMLGLSEAELAEVMSQMTYYSGQIVP